MFKTLYAKLAFVLAALLCVIGVVYISLSLYSTQMYQQEINQRLNKSLAENLVEDKPLMKDGDINTAMLEEIFHMYMVINPSIEVYLLDKNGAILGYSAPPEKIKRQSIDLAPVQRFLQHPDTLPILGDDPRSPEGRKIFSVAPVESNGRVNGYLYVVLAGEQYQSTADMLQGSYIFKLSVWTVIATLLFALIAGLILFNLLTRRLTKLSTAMKGFEKNNFVTPPRLALDTARDDEIGRLARAFDHMSQRIMEQVNALKKTDILRRELVANISHDLRTPIASLQGYLETLILKENELTQEQQQHYLTIALKHSERLSRLISELFELSRLDAGDIKVNKEAFALGDLVQDVVMKFQLGAEEKGVRLETEIPTDLPLACGDIALIDRVLQNLVENALQHTPPSGIITIALHADDNTIAVSVSDTGHGIPDDQQERIFERFYQADKHEGGRGTGAGLGLAIARRIVNLHGADIQVNSRLNHGTRFTFPLPAHSQ